MFALSAPNTVINLFLMFQSDPLGLNAAPASGDGTGEAGLGNGQRKRRPSEDTSSGGPNSFKRPKVSFIYALYSGTLNTCLKDFYKIAHE